MQTLKRLYFQIKYKIHTMIKRVQVSSNNVKFYLSCDINIDTVFEGANRIGERTSFTGKIGYGSYIGNDCKISAEIGKFCSIASKVETLSGTHPSKLFVSTSPAFYSLQKTSGVNLVQRQKFNEYKKTDNGYDVIIGNDVWIGSGVSILGGIKIGDGAIIAANSTVTKNVEPYSIVAGVPSKEIRKRFEVDQIKYLQEYRWWNKSEQWIINNAELFDNINNFINVTKRK